MDARGWRWRRIFPKTNNNVYVSKNGNDGTADGSLAKPFLTLAAALASIPPAGPGGPGPLNRFCVCMASGRYDETVPILLRGNVFILGEHWFSVRINAPSWGLDPDFTQPSGPFSDTRGGIQNAIISSASGSIDFDFNAISSVEGKFYFDTVWANNTVNITAFGPVNQYVVQNVFTFAPWNINGGQFIPRNTLFQALVTFNSGPTDPACVYEDDHSTYAGGLTINKTGVSGYQVKLYGSSIDGVLTANGSFVVDATSDAVPVDGSFVLLGGATLNRLNGAFGLAYNDALVAPPVGSNNVQGAIDSLKGYVSRVWYVDETAVASKADGSPTRQFVTIADALAVAAKGDEIRLAPGTYVETLVVTQTSLSFVSDGEAVIQGTMSFSSIGLGDQIMFDGVKVTGNLILNSGGPSQSVLKLVRTSVTSSVATVPALDVQTNGWTVSVQDASLLIAINKAQGIRLAGNQIKLNVVDSTVTGDTANLVPSLQATGNSPTVNCSRTEFVGRIQMPEGTHNFDNCGITVDPAETSYLVGGGLALFNMFNGTRVKGLPFATNYLMSGGGTVRTDGVITLDNKPVGILPPALAQNVLYASGIKSNSADHVAVVVLGAGTVALTGFLEDLIIIRDNGAATLAVTLPPASGVLVGREVTIKNYDGSIDMNVVASAGNTIDGGASFNVSVAASLTAVTLQLRKVGASFDWIVVGQG